MEIHAGGEVICGAEVFAERVWHGGAARPALRIRLNGAIDGPQLKALCAGTWELYEDGAPVGRHSGYNAMIAHEVVMAQVSSLEDMERERDAARDTADRAAREAARVRQAVSGALPLMAGNAALVNRVADALEEWMPGAYEAGDVRIFEGAPYMCVQAHDSAGKVGWSPRERALWMQYHGTSADSAREFVAPSGAQDMYRAGEYCLWEGGVWRCAEDTAFAPGTGSGWVRAEE